MKRYRLWNPFSDVESLARMQDVGPVTIVRGEGVYVYNESGDRFINGSSSLWNVAVGHGRQEIVDAASGQMKKLAYASCFSQTHPTAVKFADRLCGLTGYWYQRAYLGCNGSEAIETALKITRQYFHQNRRPELRGKYKILSFSGCYHGVSYGAISAEGDELNQRLYGPLIPGFLQVDPPYAYVGNYGTMDQEECEERCLRKIEETIEQEGPDTVAAFIAEPVMGELGIIVISDSFFDRLTEICHKNGMLFIADEVSTGFGRTGRLFVSEAFRPRPDILCVGKGISSGYLPVSATLVTGEILEEFQGDKRKLEHGSTASGHPVCCAAADANIDIILRENLCGNSEEVGAYLLRRIRELGDTRPVIGEVRGRGLMIGIELVSDREKRTPLTEEETGDISIDICLSGLLVYTSRNIIGLFPPLILSRENADSIAEILGKCLDNSPRAKIRRKKRLLSAYADAKRRRFSREVDVNGRNTEG